MFSAEGAAFIAAWGSAPGTCTCEAASAESAIHSGALSIPMSAMRGIESLTGVLSRAFSALLRDDRSLAAASWYQTAPLALKQLLSQVSAGVLQYKPFQQRLFLEVSACESR